MRHGIPILLLAAACAHSKYRCPERGGPPWIEARSANFVLQTDLPPEEATAKLVSLERLRSAMQLLWRAPVDPHAPLDLFLPQNAQEAAEFGENPVKFRITQFSEIVVVASGAADLASDPTVENTIATSLDGLFRIERVPWLALGLELYLAGARVEGGDALLGEPSLWALRSLRKRHGPSPVSWVVNETRVWASLDRGTSWLFVHYLMDAHRAELVDLLRRLGRGEPEKEAIAASFGAFEPDAFDDALDRYWKEGRLGTVRMRLPQVDEHVEIRALGEAELHAWRADLLGSRDEREEALRHDPTEPRALIGIPDDAKKIEAARASARSRPQDWRPSYLLWLFTSGLNESDDLYEFFAREKAPRNADAEAELARAAEKADVPQPHLILADLALMRGDSSTALREAEITLRMAPRRPLYLDTYAAALVASGRCPEARRVQSLALERVEIEGRRAVRDAIRDHAAEYQRRCPGG